jgi:hypothetical protein
MLFIRKGGLGGCIIGKNCSTVKCLLSIFVRLKALHSVSSETGG